jgi:hypothetical protein
MGKRAECNTLDRPICLRQEVQCREVTAKVTSPLSNPINRPSDAAHRLVYSRVDPCGQPGARPHRNSVMKQVKQTSDEIRESGLPTQN